MPLQHRRQETNCQIHELVTLTGTEALLVLVSETNHVYSYATNKFHKLVSSTDNNIIKKTLGWLKLLFTFLMSTRDGPPTKKIALEGGQVGIPSATLQAKIRELEKEIGSSHKGSRI